MSIMDYVPPLRVLGRLGNVQRTDTVITLPLEGFHALLRAAYSGSAFDPAWYRATYPDVAQAIAEGQVPDELSHFLRFGYFEHRKPRNFDVDARWYEDTYRDVAQAIRSGQVADARSHFNTSGYFEPRAPSAIAAACYAGLLELAAGQVTVAEANSEDGVIRRTRRA
jgi:hypothetical protein